ncbi:hypothetical protein A2U01_0055462 [Trifolium medium]|uniref:Uncharacterized protein n=1 Tax=Trifolium medium TaxID=97028 RepID=A0A392RDY6_9FABA|nr:hypothetical protein [Trifolium medium]
MEFGAWSGQVFELEPEFWCSEMVADGRQGSPVTLFLSVVSSLELADAR